MKSVEDFLEVEGESGKNKSSFYVFGLVVKIQRL